MKLTLVGIVLVGTAIATISVASISSANPPVPDGDPVNAAAQDADKTPPSPPSGLRVVDDGEKSKKTVDSGEKTTPPEAEKAISDAEAKLKKIYPPQDPKLGAIAGKVFLAGEPPPRRPLPLIPEKDHAHCGPKAKDERVLVSKASELKNVVIAVAGYKPPEKAKPRKVVIDNKDCVFKPHVVATTVGSTIEITNGDPMLHNARSVFPTWKRPFNNAIRAGGKITGGVRKPGWALLKCDIHPWMTGHVQVFDHDLFDVTDAVGSYRLVNVPPGEYDLELWHEALAPGTKRRPLLLKVKVEAGAAATVNLEVVPDQKSPKNNVWRVRS